LELEWFGARDVSCILQFGRLASSAAADYRCLEAALIVDGNLSTYEVVEHSMIAVVAVRAEVDWHAADSQHTLLSFFHKAVRFNSGGSLAQEKVLVTTWIRLDS
jgi:hypothetical protein